MSEKTVKGRLSNGDGTQKLTEDNTDPFLKRYKIIEKIGEGSYSEVVKCKNRETGNLAACKRLKHSYRSINQINDIAEITTLRSLARHPNILTLFEIDYDQVTGKVSLVFELMEMNLYELIKDRKRVLPETRVKSFLFQIMRALRHLHKSGIFHRDIKPENILIKPKTDFVKLADLGSVRGIESRQPYTEYISTRWYRSPECLLTTGYYSSKMDIWAVGCVFYEILTLRPLFPGSSEIDQIGKIHNVFGPPGTKMLQKFFKHADRDYESQSISSSKKARRENILKMLSELKQSKSKTIEMCFPGKDGGLDKVLPPYISGDAKELLKLLLQYDPEARPTGQRILQHPYFKDLREGVLLNIEKISYPHVLVVANDLVVRNTQEVFQDMPDIRSLGEKKKHLRRPREKASSSKLVNSSLSRQKLLASASREKKKMFKIKGEPKKTIGGLSSSEERKLKVTDSERRSVMERKRRGVTAHTQANISKALRDIDKSTTLNDLNNNQTRVPSSEMRQSFADRLSNDLSIETLEKNFKETFVDLEITLESKPSHTSIIDSHTAQNIINHRLEPDDMKKINAARQLVKMKPIPSPRLKEDIKNNNDSISNAINDSATNKINNLNESGVSTGKRSLLKDHTQQQNTSNVKKIKQISLSPKNKHPGSYLGFDKSLMSVPPSVALAAMKYSNAPSISNKNKTEDDESLRRLTKDSYKLQLDQNSNVRNNNDVHKESEREKQKKIMKEIELSARMENETEHRHWLQGGRQNIRPPVHLGPGYPEVASIRKSLLGKNKFQALSSKMTLSSRTTPLNSSIGKTSNKAYGFRSKEAELGSISERKSTIAPKESPYARYAGHAEKRTDKLNPSSKIFPRNRFDDIENNENKSVKSSGNEKPLKERLDKMFEQEYDMYKNCRDVPVISKKKESSSFKEMTKLPTSETISMKKTALNISYEDSFADSVGKNSSLKHGYSYGMKDMTRKPPASPLSNANASRFVTSTQTEKNIHPRPQKDKAKHLKQDFAQVTNNSFVKDVQKLEPEKRSNLNKTRQDRRQHHRDDVFCSSDDDVLLTMRKKIDELISDRARKISEYASRQVKDKPHDGSDLEEDPLAYRARHEPPRKQHKRDGLLKSKASTWRSYEKDKDKSHYSHSSSRNPYADLTKRKSRVPEGVNHLQVSRLQSNHNLQVQKDSLFPPSAQKPTYNSSRMGFNVARQSSLGKLNKSTTKSNNSNFFKRSLENA